MRSLWGLDADEVKFIRRVENFVYRASYEGRAVVLRLTEPVHRSIKQIESELDWMSYLSENGLALATPIKALSGQFVEEVDGKEKYFVSVFEWAPGHPISDFDSCFMENWGRYLGRMQSLSRSYLTKKEKRQAWNENSNFEVALKGLDESDEIPYRRHTELMEWASKLPKDPNSYGLVHFDLHHGNFFVENKKITAFDFDDCVYSWFIFDALIPLMHLRQKRDCEDAGFPYEKLEEAYFRGYRDELVLDEIWFKRKELFLQLRICTVYHWTKANLAAGIFSDSPNALKWCERMLEWGRKQLEEELQLF